MRLEVMKMTGGYLRDYPVLHEINFQVPPGKMVGMIGLNGAGKSTLMKHILGLMSPQSGKIKVNGKELTEDIAGFRQSIAYVPEAPILYDHLTVQEHLKFTAKAYQVDDTLFEQREEELLELFQMKEKRSVLPRHLSKGMQQKTMLMCAFITNASLFIIDEPFLGLDPLGITNLLEFMSLKKDEGASILLSSHILSTIEKHCEEYMILHRGCIASQGSTKGQDLEKLFYEIVRGTT